MSQNMANLKISVITVCFNSLEILKKTMQSVETQTYTNIEYIVIDGNSTDGTPEYLKNYNGKLTKYVSESDKGIYDAMNKGVNMSEGDYVIFLNAGDLFAENLTLEKIFDGKTYDSDVIYGDVIKNGRVKPAEKPHNAHSQQQDIQTIRPSGLDIRHDWSFKYQTIQRPERKHQHC